MSEKKRRSLTQGPSPSPGPTPTPTPSKGKSDANGAEAAAGVHATRRGGARREVSARVSLKAPSGQVLEGWALNVSRGGVRVILEEKIDLGAEFEVALITATDASASPTYNVGRIVWVQEEPDGVVAGIEFSAPAPAPGTRR